MLGSLLDFVTGAGLQLVLLMLGLLPTIDVASLPIAPPAEVVSVLGMLNMFVPIGDLISILTVWIGVILAVNVALVIANLVNSFK